jgi:predicted RNase H-like HicB family nuclease
MKKPASVSVTLTGIFFKNAKTGSYSSFIAEIPEVVAQGKSEEEAADNLFEAFQIILDVKKEKIFGNKEHAKGVTTRNIKLQLA